MEISITLTVLKFVKARGDCGVKNYIVEKQSNDICQKELILNEWVKVKYTRKYSLYNINPSMLTMCKGVKQSSIENHFVKSNHSDKKLKITQLLPINSPRRQCVLKRLEGQRKRSNSISGASRNKTTLITEQTLAKPHTHCSSAVRYFVSRCNCIGTLRRPEWSQ